MVAVRAAPEPHPEVMREPDAKQGSKYRIGLCALEGYLESSQTGTIGSKPAGEADCPHARRCGILVCALDVRWIAAAKTMSVLRAASYR